MLPVKWLDQILHFRKVEWKILNLKNLNFESIYLCEYLSQMHER